MILTGLPDTRKVRKTLMFSTITQALKILRKRVAASTASDEGAINIWNDKFGMWRCERQRYMITQSSGAFKTLKEVAAWLKVELPKIER